MGRNWKTGGAKSMKHTRDTASAEDAKNGVAGAGNAHSIHTPKEKEWEKRKKRARARKKEKGSGNKEKEGGNKKGKAQGLTTKARWGNPHTW